MKQHRCWGVEYCALSKHNEYVVNYTRNLFQNSIAVLGVFVSKYELH